MTNSPRTVAETAIAGEVKPEAMPDGYMLVPVKPSREMVKAGEEWSGLPETTWQDMLDAAPLTDFEISLEALTAERDGLLSRMEWRPIETAPKDGTEIILFCPQGDGTPGRTSRVTAGSWFIPPTHTSTPDPDVDEDEPPAWLSWDGGFSEDTMMPTHWMPLPTPPAALKETQP